MEQLLQALNLGSLLPLLAGLCIVGIALFLILHLLGLAVGIIQGVLHIAATIGSADPFGGCGCVALLLGCGVCACIAVFGYSILSTCGTDRAVMFCSWLGR